MDLDEIVDLLVANVQPEQTGELAEKIKVRLYNTCSNDILKIIADQLDKAGVTIAGIQCKASPA
jgi:glycine cleavage system regulatory protein